MATFSDEEVIKRTARALSTSPDKVREFLDAYMNAYVDHARETENSSQLHPRPRTMEQTGETPAKRAPRKATGSPRTPRKAAAKAESPANSGGTTEGSTEGQQTADEVNVSV